MLKTSVFKINNLITLKLEDDKTQIYINNENFIQCKFLLLSIPVEKLENFNEMNSIDEIAEESDKKMELDKYNLYVNPEDEFWAHCSNLQAWVENEYDTRLLHRNLAFPLLKTLSDAGDKLANLKLKEEIIMRYKYGNYTMQAFLFEQKFLSYLTYDEKFSGLLEPEDAIFMEKIQKKSDYYRFIPCFDLIRNIPETDNIFLSIEQGKIKELHIRLKDGISEIPKEIGNLTSLHTLIIEVIDHCDNIFRQINLIKLESVKKLKIFCFSPIIIPNSLNIFPRLEWLIIRGIDCMPIINLHNSFISLKKLHLLELDSVNINQIPDSIENLENLENLKIRETMIKTIPTEILLKLPLKALSILYNPQLRIKTEDLELVKKKIKNVNYSQ